MRAGLLRVVVHVGIFVGFAASDFAVASWLAAARDARSPATCLGSSQASRHIVYLHGLDSLAPSWQELDNRRALAAIPDAQIALPRAPTCGAGRCWSDDDDGTTETVAAIRDAARTCFGQHASYGVIGFSRGGFALARLPSCSTAGAQWAVLAGSFGYTNDQRLRDCPVAVVIGRRDRYHHEGAVHYAQQRQAASLPTFLFEVDGGHHLDAAALTSAVDALERAARQR